MSEAGGRVAGGPPRHRLRQAGGEELAALLAAAAGRLSADEALAAPLAAVLPLLPHLGKRDLLTVARDLRLSTAVRRRASLLAGEDAGGARFDRPRGEE
jgi:hypothetical protein